MFDFLNNILGRIFPKASQGLDRLKTDFQQTELYDKLTAPRQYREKSEAALQSMADAFSGYSAEAERLLGAPPQIDLSGFQETLGGYESDLLDSYLRSAGMIEGASQRGLDEALGGYQAYLNQYRDLARQDIPGMDIYRGRIGAGTTSTIQQLKDIGGLTAGAVAGAAASQNENLRDLAIQSGMYRAQRQEALANVYAQYGNAVQGAYTNQANALQAAAGMRGAGITGAANLANQQAAIQQQQYQYNELMPWQAGLNYNQQMAMATMPYQSQMQYNSEMMAYEQARRQAAAQGLMNVWSGAMSQYNDWQNQIAGAVLPFIGKGNVKGAVPNPNYNQGMIPQPAPLPYNPQTPQSIPGTIPNYIQTPTIR